MLTTSGGSRSSTSFSRPRSSKQRELRGLFEFNLSGEALDAYVKKQVNDYREQAKAFGLAK
ncbi:hypothetical protein DMH27_10710 [Raoultella planticola]|nr:hypothetical protein [Raoultella planticola]